MPSAQLVINIEASIALLCAILTALTLLFILIIWFDRAGCDIPHTLCLTTRSTPPFPTYLLQILHRIMNPTGSERSNRPMKIVEDGRVPTTILPLVQGVRQWNCFEEFVQQYIGTRWQQRFGVTHGCTSLDYRAHVIDNRIVQLTPGDSSRFPVFIQDHEWELPIDDLRLLFLTRVLPWQTDLMKHVHYCLEAKELGMPEAPVVSSLIFTHEWTELLRTPNPVHALRNMLEKYAPQLGKLEAWVCMYRQALAVNPHVQPPNAFMLEAWRAEPLYDIKYSAKGHIIGVLHAGREPSHAGGMDFYIDVRTRLWTEVLSDRNLRDKFLSEPLHPHERWLWERAECGFRRYSDRDDAEPVPPPPSRDPRDLIRTSSVISNPSSSTRATQGDSTSSLPFKRMSFGGFSFPLSLPIRLPTEPQSDLTSTPDQRQADLTARPSKRRPTQADLTAVPTQRRLLGPKIISLPPTPGPTEDDSSSSETDEESAEDNTVPVVDVDGPGTHDADMEVDSNEDPSAETHRDVHAGFVHARASSPHVLPREDIPDVDDDSMTAPKGCVDYPGIPHWHTLDASVPKVGPPRLVITSHRRRPDSPTTLTPPPTDSTRDSQASNASRLDRMIVYQYRRGDSARFVRSHSWPQDAPWRDTIDSLLQDKSRFNDGGKQ